MNEEFLNKHLYTMRADSKSARKAAISRKRNKGKDIERDLARDRKLKELMEG
jgi:hypothetical protein